MRTIGRNLSLVALLMSGGCFVTKAEMEATRDGDDDGMVLGEDCDPADSSTGREEVWYRDSDGDGYGDPNEQASGAPCSATPAGYTSVAGDCDDGSATTSPEAAEICDDVDNDCDQLVDANDDSLTPTEWYVDEDGDGFGAETIATMTCEQPEETSTEGGDCDDGSETSYPGAYEACGDQVDQDCSGVPDEDGSACETTLECTETAACDTSDFSGTNLCRCSCSDTSSMRLTIQGLNDPLEDWYVGAEWTIESEDTSVGPLSCPSDFIYEAEGDLAGSDDSVLVEISFACDALTTDWMTQWYERIENGEIDRRTMNLDILSSSGEQMREWTFYNTIITQLQPAPPCEGVAVLKLSASSYIVER